MKVILLLLLCLAFSLFGVAPVSADAGMTDDEIWDSCWTGDHAATRRIINYPEPIHLTIHNISWNDCEICVFDNLCPHTMFKGSLRHNYSITLSACANRRGRGSISVMNADGEMWFFDDTRDRIITIKK